MPGTQLAQFMARFNSAGSALDFLERTALDAQVSSDKIRAIASRVENQATYPASQLGNSLKLVAKLIGGGLATRVFYVSQGGYDTHTNQTGTHERLLKELGDSVKAFVADLKAQGNLSRVLVMTFSEFGRRVAENASSGTDHGAAAPMFVIGDKVKAGLLGKYPSLAPSDLFQGDLKYNLDFRSRLCRRAGELAEDEERSDSWPAVYAAANCLVPRNVAMSKNNRAPGFPKDRLRKSF